MQKTWVQKIGDALYSKLHSMENPSYENFVRKKGLKSGLNREFWMNPMIEVRESDCAGILTGIAGL